MTTLPPRTRPEGCITDMRFDALFSGELDGDDGRELRPHLESCARCQQRHAALLTERERFLQGAPSFVAPSPRAKRPMRWAPVAAGLALAASVLLAVRPGPDGADTRTKGSERLGFFVKHGDAVRRGAPGERVAPGDSLRFAYSAPASRYLTILSLDGAARASVYFPPGARGLTVSAGSDVSLDFSVELDDTLGTERILGLFCDQAHESEPLRAALERDGASFHAPSDCSSVALTIVKEAAP